MNLYRFRQWLCVICLAGWLLTACGTSSTQETPTPTQTPGPTATLARITVGTATGMPQQSPPAAPTTATTQSNATLGPSPADRMTFPQYSGIDLQKYDQDNNDSLDPSELRAAIEDIYPLYVWPTDYQLPMESIRNGVPTEIMGDPVTFELGYVYTMVDFPFGCAWMSQYVADLEQDNQEDADRSFAVIREWVTASPVWAEYDQERWQGWLDDAELGDPSFIRQFVTRSCSGFPFEKNPAAATSRSQRADNFAHGVILHQ